MQENMENPPNEKTSVASMTSSESPEASPKKTRRTPHLGNTLLETYPEVNDTTEWISVGTRIRGFPPHERNYQISYCCLRSVKLRTLIMADEKWLEILPEMMLRSEALSFMVNAHAANWLADEAGATRAPTTALTYYSRGLRELQRDLHNPTRSLSDETLFTIVLLAVFDV